MMKTNDVHTASFLISISDIRDRYYEGHKLSSDEIKALENFDKYRIAELNRAENTTEFDKNYFQLQVLENLHPFQDFIEYSKIPELMK